MNSTYTHSTTSTMIATMGGQPQVVTFALDALLARGETIHDVLILVVAPDSARIRRAAARLSAEFQGGTYRGQTCRLHWHPVRLGQVNLPDIRNEQDADIAWNFVHQLVGSLKAQGRVLHLCIAGGRRILALLSLSAAMLNFGHADRMWHLYTPDQFRQAAAEGAIMHAGPEDGVVLIQVPLAPLGAYFPPLRQLAAAPAAEILAKQTRWLDEATRTRCRAVVERLSARQCDVLQAFAQGMNPQAVAEHCSITLATVNTHKTAILAECRNAWELDTDAWLTYHFLYDKFGPWFGVAGSG